MAKRLWEKGEELNQQVHAFTVGDDPIVDRELAYWDLIGSAAHVKMLRQVGLISIDECTVLLAGLQHLSGPCKAQNFDIPFELEDCHTAIETRLLADVGDVAGKVHTGRSRNDQVMVAMRLYLRERLVSGCAEACRTAQAFFDRAEDCGHQPMPGYTHFQPAMPSSLKLWLQAFGESFLDCARDALLLLESIDSCPLGAASGFGTSLPLDREITSEVLGFARVQRNPISVQNSRGQQELKCLRWSCDAAGIIEKFALDLILYTTREYGFFSLPTAFTTGSSIMPQKHNPDVLELLRGRAAKIRGAEDELSWVLAKLPSNYHRDFQYSKEPLVRGLRHLFEMLPILREVIASFTVNKDRLEAAMTPDLYATYDAYREVKAGTAFRDAYRKTARRIKSGDIKREELETDFEPIARTCDAELGEARKDLDHFQRELLKWSTVISEVEAQAFVP
jgi:argininosuccinate lyase